MLKPKPLLHIEGAAVLISACVLYRQSQAAWLWFGLLFFAPDLSMLGYFAGKKLGSALYNLVHTYTAPILALSTLWFSGRTSHSWVILIWLAHVGFDRMLGYGLKYETAFKDTHLQRV
jgi:hypothetical protein